MMNTYTYTYVCMHLYIYFTYIFGILFSFYCSSSKVVVVICVRISLLKLFTWFIGTIFEKFSFHFCCAIRFLHSQSTLNVCILFSVFPLSLSSFILSAALSDFMCITGIKSFLCSHTL